MFNVKPKLIFLSTPLGIYYFLPRVFSSLTAIILWLGCIISKIRKKEKTLQMDLAEKSESIEQISLALFSPSPFFQP